MTAPAAPGAIADRTSPAERGLVHALFFVSGATALVYQTVWVRSLTLAFGASHEAVAIVLGSFMTGLAIGGVVGGRWSRRLRRPLLAYGMLELAIAASAALVPWLQGLAQGGYVAAALAIEGVPWSLQLLRIVLAFVVLLPPTILMGATLPVLVHHLVRRYGELARLSTLYGINTAGAVAGTLSAGFFLLPAFGVAWTQMTAIVANLALAVVAVAFGLRRRGAVATDRAGATALDEESPPIGSGRGPLRLAYYATAVSGFCALSLEVLWMRSITVVVGNTAYSFSVMLAAFLVGIALGSWVNALVPQRRETVARRLGCVMLAAGLSSLLATQLVPQLPRLAVLVFSWVGSGEQGVRSGYTLLLSFAVMLVPSVLFGAAFPISGEAGTYLRRDFGLAVGNLVGWNTLGAIVGSLATGFLLIPAIGLQRSMLCVSALDAGYGLVVLSVAARVGATRRQRRLATALAGLAVVAAVLVPWQLARWDYRALAVFRNNALRPGLDLRQMIESSRVLYYEEGRSATVSVAESGRTRALVIDGKTVATEGLSDMQHELLLGHVPVLLHPRPRTAAVVGLGAGITLGSVLAHPDLESVVLVEIEPAVLGGARQFSDVNGAALEDPRLEVVEQDGRNYLLTTTRRFDVITADPIHPWARGAAYLYTREYYDLTRDHLTPGGMMCQWLPLYELSLENVRSAIGTFADAFPHVQVWQAADDAILIGSTRPVSVDARQLQDRLRRPRVAAQLRQIGLADAFSFLAELTLDDSGARDLGAGAVRNTDDNLYLEFSSPLSIARSDLAGVLAALEERRAPFDRVLTKPVPDELKARARAYGRAKAESLRAQILLAQQRQDGAAAELEPLIDRLRSVVETVPDYGRARAILAELHLARAARLAAAGDATAGEELESAIEVMPESAVAHFRLGTRLSEQGELAAAQPHLDAALESNPRFAAAYINRGVNALRRGDAAAAVEDLRRAIALRPDDGSAHSMLAAALAESGDGEGARRSFERALALEPDLPELAGNFAAFLYRQGETEAARQVLRAALSRRPDDNGLRRRLEAIEAPAGESP